MCRAALVAATLVAATGCGGGQDAEPLATAAAPMTDPIATEPVPESVPVTTRPPAPTVPEEPETTSTTTSVSTTLPAPTTTAVEENCRRIDDFDVDTATWFIVNDGVMGGRSDGRFAIEDSNLAFAGTVVTAGGGFTSVRIRLNGDELAGTERIRLRLRADDRTYAMTFEDDQDVQGRSISHGADLPKSAEVDDDGYAVVELDYAALSPTIFGRSVEAQAFRPDAAAEIGVIIADGIDGDFAVAIDWIDACG